MIKTTTKGKYICIALTPIEYAILYGSKIPHAEVEFEGHKVVNIEITDLNRISSLLNWKKIQHPKVPSAEQNLNGIKELHDTHVVINSLLDELESRGVALDTLLASLSLNLLEFSEKHTLRKISPDHNSKKH